MVERNQLEKLGILVNSKAIPFVEGPPGIRAGTTVLTQRGMGAAEVKVIADLFLLAAQAPDSSAVHTEITRRVRMLTDAFPLPG